MAARTQSVAVLYWLCAPHWLSCAADTAAAAQKKVFCVFPITSTIFSSCVDGVCVLPSKAHCGYLAPTLSRLRWKLSIMYNLTPAVPIAKIIIVQKNYHIQVHFFSSLFSPCSPAMSQRASQGNKIKKFSWESSVEATRLTGWYTHYKLIDPFGLWLISSSQSCWFPETSGQSKMIFHSEAKLYKNLQTPLISLVQPS